ncbi:MAG TPA: tail fiber domain-containing protein [Pyrinomonadaceae bacterium]|nr:tail fiber domain-containing protein [Pyrinomonadaceae bacterium]
MGEVQQTRLQIFSADGALAFDSGYRMGNTIDWQLTDQQGARLADGSYIFLVTVKDFSERITQKYGTAILEQSEVYLERTNRGAMPQAQATALETSKQSEALAPIDRIGAAGLNRTAAVAVTETRGAAETKTSKKEGASSTATQSDNATTGTANVSGTGTTNNLVKWADGPTGTLADSVITESGGKVGINNTNPQAKLDVTGNALIGTTKVNIGGSGNGVDYPSIGYNTAYTDTGNTYNYRIGDSAQLLRFGNGNTATSRAFEFKAAGSGPAGTPINFSDLMTILYNGNVGINVTAPTERLVIGGNVRLTGAGNGLIFADGTKQTSAAASIAGQNAWTGQNTFVNGLSANNVAITNVGNPVSATDATNKAYVDANTVRFVPGAEQLSVGDANGTAPMINLRGGSTCCSGPGGHTPAWFKVFQNGSFVATGNLGIGVSPMQGKGYRTSWDSYKGAFRSGYADNEWDDANVGFFSWAGGSNSTAIGLYALAFGDTNSAESTSSIVFGSGNQVKGAAGFSAGAGNRVCDTYGVALGNNAKSGGPLINGKCDPDTFNIRGLAAVAIGYNVTADQDHTTAMGKFASNNGFTGTFVWSDGSATQSADTFRNTANNEFALRATGGFRFRTNLGGTTGCNLPAGSGVFNCTSSRYTKENFMTMGGEDVLARLRRIPVMTWNYISEGKQVRHIGPFAEDFYQAFNFGTSNTSVGLQDLAGVNMAAVKALDARTVELQKKTLELQEKTAEVEQLRSRVSVLEERIANIERAVQATQNK